MSGRRYEPTWGGDATFVRRLLIVLLVGALAVSVWYLADLLLLLFGSILVAVVLRAVADPINARLGIPESVALAIAGLLVLGVLLSGILLFGAQIGQQMALIAERVPGAISRLSSELRIESFVEWLKSSDSASSLGNLATRLMSWSTTLIGGVASLFVVLIAGIYLAADPLLYRDGLLKLVPAALQPQAQATIDDCANALRRWLGGQLLAMLLVGILITIGLLMIGVPSALALGFIAGLAEFVPYVGPIAAAIPAVLVASSHSWEMVWWTIGVYVVVQQVENNVIIPLIARQSVSIAPAVGIFAIIAMGILLGPLGLLLAFPLVVVLDVAVRRLYVRDTLDRDVEILGEPAAPSIEAAKDADQK